MGKTTAIPYVESTLNFWQGCTFVIEPDPATGVKDISKSPCGRCYVWRIKKERFGMLEMTDFDKRLKDLISWTPRRIFVENMGDFFHEAISDDIRDNALSILKQADEHHAGAYGKMHQYLILTKRPDNMERYFSTRAVPDNVWLGVSVGAKSAVKYVEVLKRVKAKIKWVSVEPLIEHLGPVNFTGIQWTVIGGESDFEKPRPMPPAAAIAAVHDAREAGCAVWFKQRGGLGGEGAGGDLFYDSKVYHELPVYDDRVVAPAPKKVENTLEMWMQTQ